MGEKRDAYVEKLKSKMDEWNRDIDKLEAKTGQMAADARLKYQKQIEGLKARQKEVKDKMDKLQKSSAEAWVDLKAGMNSAWKALGESVKSAKSKFK